MKSRKIVLVFSTKGNSHFCKNETKKILTKHRPKRRPAIKQVSRTMFALRASDVAFGNDVYCVSDVAPGGAVGKRHITRDRREQHNYERSE